MKFAKWGCLGLLAVAAFVLVIVVVFTPRETKSRPGAKGETVVQEVPQPRIQEVPLELISSTGITTEYATEVTGKVRNNRSRKYSYVQITFTVYNKAGEQVGTALANTNDLEPGGVWAFKAIYFGKGGVRFKNTGLSGW